MFGYASQCHIAVLSFINKSELGLHVGPYIVHKICLWLLNILLNSSRPLDMHVIQRWASLSLHVSITCRELGLAGFSFIPVLNDWPVINNDVEH